jgi:excisionase family DNA binding protein
MERDTFPSGTYRPRVRDVGPDPFGSLEAGFRAGNQTELFTISEIAELLHVVPRTVRRWIEGRHLAVHRIGGVQRISASDLRAFLARHREA